MISVNKVLLSLERFEIIKLDFFSQKPSYCKSKDKTWQKTNDTRSESDDSHYHIDQAAWGTPSNPWDEYVLSVEHGLYIKNRILTNGYKYNCSYLHKYGEALPEESSTRQYVYRRTESFNHNAWRCQKTAEWSTTKEVSAYPRWWKIWTANLMSKKGTRSVIVLFSYSIWIHKFSISKMIDKSEMLAFAVQTLT